MKTNFCSVCKKSVSEKVYDYSLRHFGKILCYGCQPVIEKTSFAPPTKSELNKSAGIENWGKLPKRKPIHDGY